jgi:hypothetical protein
VVGFTIGSREKVSGKTYEKKIIINNNNNNNNTAVIITVLIENSW